MLALLLHGGWDTLIAAALFWLSQLHFGRFGLFAEIVSGLLGLIPANLAFTGFFVCCRRVFYNSPSNPESRRITGLT